MSKKNVRVQLVAGFNPGSGFETTKLYGRNPAEVLGNKKAQAWETEQRLLYSAKVRREALDREILLAGQKWARMNEIRAEYPRLLSLLPQADHDTLPFIRQSIALLEKEALSLGLVLKDPKSAKKEEKKDQKPQQKGWWDEVK